MRRAMCGHGYCKAGCVPHCRTDYFTNSITDGYIVPFADRLPYCCAYCWSYRCAHCCTDSYAYDLSNYRTFCSAHIIAHRCAHIIANACYVQ